MYSPFHTASLNPVENSPMKCLTPLLVTLAHFHTVLLEVPTSWVLLAPKSPLWFYRLPLLQNRRLPFLGYAHFQVLKDDPLFPGLPPENRVMRKGFM